MSTTVEAVRVPHVIRGRVVVDSAIEHGSGDDRFVTPKLDVDELVLPRSLPGPAFGLPLSDVLDLLVETGARLRADENGYLAEALESMVRTTDVGRRILGLCFDAIPTLFDRAGMELMVAREVGADKLDGWSAAPRADGRTALVRAFPPRAVHIMAGNAPYVAAITIIRAALSKGVHLLKVPSNDLLTASAILRTMIDIDADHPTVRSLAAVYWRGGDVSIEDLIYRAQFFDKLVVWGGEGAVRNALRYAGPGLELVSFDPKSSVSLIGSEAFASAEALGEAAALGAGDAGLFNQDACSASRYHFVEGTSQQADDYAAALAGELAVDHPLGDGLAAPTPTELRDHIDGLRYLGDAYGVFGDYDGHGVVVRSDEPVDFHPEAKTVNVVPVRRLSDAIAHVTVATQTVGVYPADRRPEVRDGLAAAGAVRIVPLGGAQGGAPGLPHDGMYPLHRLMRWVVDDG